MQPKHGLHIPSGKFNLMSLIIIGLRMKALFFSVKNSVLKTVQTNLMYKEK
jgi:hypothetical protein